MGLVALTPDLSSFATTQGFLDEYRIQTAQPAATVADMYADVMEPGNKAKDVKAGVVTNASGYFTVTYPAGFWKKEPSLNVSPIGASAGNGAITYKPVKTKVNDSWTIGITFLMSPTAITVVVAGSTPLWTNPGVVTFDYQAYEQT